MNANADRSQGFQPGELVRARVSAQRLIAGQQYEVIDRFDDDGRVTYVVLRVSAVAGQELVIKNLPLLAERIPVAS